MWSAPPIPPRETWIHLRKYGYAPGNYMMRCPICKEMKYNVDKRAFACKECAEQLYEKDNTIFLQADH